MLFLPLKRYNGIPVGNHPGAFGYRRKHDIHTGVDLYTNENEPVYAIESGIITSIEWFTGAKDGSPWWEDTQCICIEGKDFVLCYGELTPINELQIGQKIKANQKIGIVKPVVKKTHPEIPGHSNNMLHVELYTKDRKIASDPWHLDKPKHSYLLDPTPYLLRLDVLNSHAFESNKILFYPIDKEEVWNAVEDGMHLRDVVVNVARKRFNEILTVESLNFCRNNEHKIHILVKEFLNENKLKWSSQWRLYKYLN